MAETETKLLTAILIVVLIGLVLLYIEGTPKTSQMPVYRTSTVEPEAVIYVDTPPVYWNYVPAWSGFYGQRWGYGGGSYGGGLPGWHHGGKIPGGGFGGGHHGGHGGGSPPPPAPAPAPAPAPSPPPSA